MKNLISLIIVVLVLFGAAGVTKGQNQIVNFEVWAGDLQFAITKCGALPKAQINIAEDLYNPPLDSEPKAFTKKKMQFRALTCMWTGPTTKWAWKYTIEGSLYGFDKAGNLISYEGTPDGKFNACHNRVLVVIYQKAQIGEPEEDKTPMCPNQPYTGVAIANVKNFGLMINDQGQCVTQPPPPANYCKTVNGAANINQLTIDQVNAMPGWEVVGDKECRTKQEPVCDSIDGQANSTGITVKMAKAMGYQVEGGKCFKPEPICQTVKQNGQVVNTYLTIKEAIAQGYKIDKHQGCELKGSGGFWSGFARVACGAGTGFALDAIRTGNIFSMRSLGAAGMGAAGGFATFGIPWAKDSSHWFTGCAGGLTVLLLPPGKDGKCAADQTPVYGSDGKTLIACGTKTLLPGDTTGGVNKPRVLLGFAGESTVGGSQTNNNKPDEPAPKKSKVSVDGNPY